MAHATEDDAVIEAEPRKTSRRRGDVRMVEPTNEELRQEVKRLKEDLIKTRKELKEAQREVKPNRSGQKPLWEVSCYGCGEKGHFRRSCPHSQEASQGNGSQQLDQQ